MIPQHLRVAVHPEGHRVQFDPVQHEYLWNGEALTSVTTLIKTYFKPFDEGAVATRLAQRDGVTVEALREAWRIKRDRAGAFGSKIHFMAETILNSGNLVAADAHVADERERAYVAVLKQAIVRIQKFYEIIETEKILFSPARKIAGTIDLLLRNKVTGVYVIADWKTSREIKVKSYASAMGLGPCFDLPDCNHSHYSLQLHAYRHLLLSEGYLPKDASVDAILVHLKSGAEGVTCEYVKPREVATITQQIFMGRDPGVRREREEDAATFR